MEYENLNITKFKLSSNLTVTYEGEDGREYSITDNQVPHPDLTMALKAFVSRLASMFYAKSDKDYSCTGFTKSSKGEDEFLVLTGKVLSPEGHTIGISSGQIDTDDTEIKDTLTVLCKEILEYFFKGKTAQGKFDFDSDPDKK